MTTRPYPYQSPEPAWRRDPHFEPWPFLLWLEYQCRRPGHHWDRAKLVEITGRDYNTVHSWTSPVRALPTRDTDAIAALAMATGVPASNIAAIVEQSQVERAAGSESNVQAVADRIILCLRRDPSAFLRALTPAVRTGLVRHVLALIADDPDALA